MRNLNLDYFEHVDLKNHNRFAVSSEDFQLQTVTVVVILFIL